METLITQWLDQRQVDYRLLIQSWSQPPASKRRRKNERIGTLQMVKCILLKDMGNQYALACIAGDRSVDPKKVRSGTGARSDDLRITEDVEAITDWAGCRARTLKRHMPIIFDQLSSE